METQDTPTVLIDTDTANIVHLMRAQSNPHLKSKLKQSPTRIYTMNAVDITLEQDAFFVKDNIYEFSHGLVNFLTNPNVLYGDIEENETTIKCFYTILYFSRKGDKRSSSCRTIKGTLGVKMMYSVRV